MLIRFFAAALAALTLIGCADTSPAPSDSKTTSTAAHDHDHGAEAGHTHGGWWCAEHGIPEGECSQCNATLAADFQKKGDWCKEHNRADSQCFVCHPELEAKFAAKYEAKYGKQPPKLEQEEKAVKN
jgi:hypothetical protein